MNTSAGNTNFPEWPVVDDAVRRVFEEMLQDGSWGRYHGPHCEDLKAELAEFHQTEHVILCCSGTAAVELALRAANVGPGDEVILAAYDYKANFANVLSVGATPVLVDTLPGVPVLDIAELQKAATENTRSIVCSHLHGSFIDIAAVNQFAAERDLVVIEDACQATGGKVQGRHAGSLSRLGVLSFGGSKLLTAGRGGAVLTNDGLLAQRIRLHTQRGNDAYPLSEMQAAVLKPQLRQLESRNLHRRQAVVRLLRRMSNQTAVVSACHPETSPVPGDLPAYYKLGLRWDGHSDTTRDEYCRAARAAGVALDRAFRPLHLTHSKRRFRAVGELPNASSLDENLMILHHPVLLDSNDGIDRLADTLMSLL